MSTPIFVFGSNTQGRHGAGAALIARLQYGAEYGVSEGRTGNSYAIITKELRASFPKVTLAHVAQGVNKFLQYARANPDLRFILTPIGTGLAGFTNAQIKPLFTNVVMPQEFK
jgi:hypothetical protein